MAPTFVRKPYILHAGYISIYQKADLTFAWPTTFIVNARPLLNDNVLLYSHFLRFSSSYFIPLDMLLTFLAAGADPERNLTRAQPKSRGCGYMGVALSMGSYKRDLADAAQLSA